MEVVSNNYLPGDQRLVDQIVHELKSQGIFDQFRRECIADVDTKPAYQNLRQRVEGSVTGFLTNQTWQPDMNKNQVREMLRKNIHESGFLEIGVERIVDQVVNPKINSIFHPKVEEIVYKFLGVEQPNRFEIKKEIPKAFITHEDLLPTDLEAVSPESVSADMMIDDSKDGLSNNNFQDHDDSKGDDDESPPFEPLEGQTNATFHHEEHSADSHVSDISGLANQESNSDCKVMPMEISNPDSQMSMNSSESRLSIVSDETSKMEICENSESSLSNNIKTDVSFDSQNGVEIILQLQVKQKSDESSKNENDIKCEDKKSDSKKYIDNKKTEKPKSDDKKSDRHKSSTDRHKSRHEKDKEDKSKRDKDKDRSSKHHSSSKDRKDRSKEHKDLKVSKSEKERENKSEKPEKVKSEKHKSEKDKSCNDKSEKYRADKEKHDSNKSEKHRSDKDSHEKEKHKSDRDKSGDRLKSKDKSDKDRPDKEKSSKSKSDKEKDKDGKKDKVDKDKSGGDKNSKDKNHRDKSLKDKNDRSRSDRDKGDKEKTDKDRNSKDRTDRDKSDKDKSNKEKVEKSEKNKTEKSEKSKFEKVRSDKSRPEKDKNEKSEKEKSEKPEDAKEKNDYKTSGNSRHSSSSKDKNSTKKESSSKDREKEKSKSVSSKETKNTKNNSNDSQSKDHKSKSSTNKKDDKQSDSKRSKDRKKAKDDHYSAHDKKHDRRSTDRDSNDGHSSKHSFHNSSCDSNSHFLSQKSNSQGSSNSSYSGSGDSGNSDHIESSKTLDNLVNTISEIPASQTTTVLPKLSPVKLIKPKFASNIYEARRLMKIRKRLSKLEKHNKLNLTNVEVAPTSLISAQKNVKQVDNKENEKEKVTKAPYNGQVGHEKLHPGKTDIEGIKQRLKNIKTYKKQFHNKNNANIALPKANHQQVTDKLKAVIKRRTNIKQSLANEMKTTKHVFKTKIKNKLKNKTHLKNDEKLTTKKEKRSKIVKDSEKIKTINKKMFKGFTKSEMAVPSLSLKLLKFNKRLGIIPEDLNKIKRAVSPHVKEPNVEITPPLKDTVITMESWDALEAKLNREMLNVNYDSYESPDIDFSTSPVKQRTTFKGIVVKPPSKNPLTFQDTPLEECGVSDVSKGNFEIGKKCSEEDSVFQTNEEMDCSVQEVEATKNNGNNVCGNVVVESDNIVQEINEINNEENIHNTESSISEFAIELKDATKKVDVRKVDEGIMTKQSDLYVATQEAVEILNTLGGSSASTNSDHKKEETAEEMKNNLKCLVVNIEKQSFKENSEAHELDEHGNEIGHKEVVEVLNIDTVDNETTEIIPVIKEEKSSNLDQHKCMVTEIFSKTEVNKSSQEINSLSNKGTIPHTFLAIKEEQEVKETLAIDEKNKSLFNEIIKVKTNGELALKKEQKLDLEDSEEECKYLEKPKEDTELYLKSLHKQIECMEKYISEQTDRITKLTCSSSDVSSPKKRGRKRKCQEDAANINNNNQETENATIAKRSKRNNSVQKLKEEHTPTNSDVSLNDSLNSVSTSPRSDTLNNLEENTSPESSAKKTTPESPNRHKERTKAGNQRYTSDDLYKPRPNFANSRRTRGSSN